MSDDAEPIPAFLQELLRLNRNQSGFRDAVRRILGPVEEWANEGDVYFTGQESGVEVLTESDGAVAAVFLFSTHSEGEVAYEGALPSDLAFGMSRDQVREVLGIPEESREPNMHLGDIICPWDKFPVGGVWLHVQYLLDASQIQGVTLLPLAKGRQNKQLQQTRRG